MYIKSLDYSKYCTARVGQHQDILTYRKPSIGNSPMSKMADCFAPRVYSTAGDHAVTTHLAGIRSEPKEEEPAACQLIY